MATQFTLEALEARHGDALLLHWGPPTQPNLIVIDGGPPGVWARSLSVRLEELREARETPLPIAAVMVSHVDDDHIRGLLDMTDKMERRADQGKPPLYRIDSIWFNTFDDIVGNVEIAAFTSPGIAPEGAEGAAAVVASVGQGRTLRDRAARLGLAVNRGRRLVRSGDSFDMGGGLVFQVLGPSRTRLEEFQAAWDAEVEARGWAASSRAAEVAAYLDDSPWNLASTVVLAKLGTKRMLLTGDARGDDILRGLDEAGLLAANGIQVDLLKVPHHGSDRNVETEFFRRVRAKHYVISGDGEHGNPEIATLRMIVDARGSASYKVHLTHRTGVDGLGARLTSFLAGLPATTRAKFNFRKEDAVSLSVAL